MSRQAFSVGRSLLSLTACHIVTARARERGELPRTVQDRSRLTLEDVAALRRDALHPVSSCRKHEGGSGRIRIYNGLDILGRIDIDCSWANLNCGEKTKKDQAK